MDPLGYLTTKSTLKQFKASARPRDLVASTYEELFVCF